MMMILSPPPPPQKEGGDWKDGDNEEEVFRRHPSPNTNCPCLDPDEAGTILEEEEFDDFDGAGIICRLLAVKEGSCCCGGATANC